jgi:hypothetical protein
MPSNRVRYLRFTTRSLLLVVTLIAIWCGHHANQAHWHRRALSRVEELDGVTWLPQSMSISSWSDSYKDTIR